MKSKKTFSDEFLSAFVDDQLTPEEKAEAYDHINQDMAVNMQVCELRKVRDLVQLAYRNPPAPPTRRRPPKGGAVLGNITNIAASLLLLVAAGLGWQWTKSLNSETVPAPTTSAQQAAVTPSGQMKVLIHLNSGDEAHMQDALNEVENLLKFYRKTHQQARIEFVTNGEGINLLRTDVSPFTERVERLQREYDNLTFVACKNSFDILSGEPDITNHLIPGAVVIDSGVAQIMRRQQQGWAYIQV